MPSAAAPDDSRADLLAKRLGFQRVPKEAVTLKGPGPASANPMLSLVADPSLTNMYDWRTRIRARSQQRETSQRRHAPSAKAVEPVLVDEEEPGGVLGGNDTVANAQLLPRFGSGKGRQPANRVLGAIGPGPAASAFDAAAEDNGSIELAADTGLRPATRRQTSGSIGDGPHGPSGDDSGDFDFYAVDDAAAGARLMVDVDTPVSDLDSALILFDATGRAIAGNDDEAGSVDSLLSVILPASGSYYLAVAAYNALPGDPRDSGSGEGSGSLGDYEVTFGLAAQDVDYYAVDLRAGDVLSGSASAAATRLSVVAPSRQEVIGSTQDASGVYPILSPLGGGGNAVVDHVAATTGRYYIATEGQVGGYRIDLEVYRSGPERRQAVQTIFLDFDGERVNTAAFGSPRGVTELSPVSAFLGRWGIPASQESALISRVSATVAENLERDVEGTGVRVEVRTSRDTAADPFGEPNVSRVVIGGTQAESGLATIGIAQSIDPGNFDTAETALVLLDLLSERGDAGGAPYSLNTYLAPDSDRVSFVGTALGNVASHEAGHYLGSWHVDQNNTVLNVMDQGGNFPLLFGVGPDGVGGTADDPDVDFGLDRLNPAEGFTGLEDTRARTRWGLTP
jgi:hypothetical protein